MRKIFYTIIITLAALSFANGQDKGLLLDVMPQILNKVSYEGVVQVDSTSKDILYARGKRWLVGSYKSANDVIQLDDKENGEIIGKGWFGEIWQVTAFSFLDVKVFHTIKLQFKDNRFRYEITDVRFKYRTPSSTIGASYISGVDVDVSPEEFSMNRKKNAKKFLIKVHAQIEKSIDDITRGMNIPTSSETDW